MERVTRLQGEVESMYKRASHVENSLDETIKKALRDKDELYGKIIESKEEILKGRDKQIKEQSRNMKERKRESRKNFFRKRKTRPAKKTHRNLSIM